jgi:hypothetical protein
MRALRWDALALIAVPAAACAQFRGSDAQPDAADADDSGDAAPQDVATAPEGEASADAADGAPTVASITSSMGVFEVGQSVLGRVFLSEAAPPAGTTVLLTAGDPSVLAVPSDVLVVGGQTTATFSVAGLRPGRSSMLGSAGGQTVSTDELVLGLYLAEVFYLDATAPPAGRQWVRLHNTTPNAIDLSQYSLGAGHGSYVETTVQLAGMIPPKACFVVGGPASGPDNGSPTFGQSVLIDPTIPAGGTVGAGVAVFAAPAKSLQSTTLPLDSVVYGTTNGGALRARDGTVAPSVIAGDVTAGDSLMLLGGTWQDHAPPAPGSCGQ